MENKNAKTKKNRRCIKKDPFLGARKILQNGIDNAVSADGRKKFTVGKQKAERRLRMLRAEGPAALRQIPSCSAKHCLWLIHKKVKSQAVGVN